MTEEEWLACADLSKMLPLLRGRATERKLRLFACCCCRRIGELLCEAGRMALEGAEWYADGGIKKDDLRSLLQRVEYDDERELWMREELAHLQLSFRRAAGAVICAAGVIGFGCGWRDTPQGR